MPDRTQVCGKILGRLLVRGERPNEIGDSWFSAKAIVVVRTMWLIVRGSSVYGVATGLMLVCSHLSNTNTGTGLRVAERY